MRIRGIAFAIFITAGLAAGLWWTDGLGEPAEGAPPYAEADLEPPDDPYAWVREWRRPEGPPRVGLQAGHWKNDEVPEELNRLVGNTGSSGGGDAEWEVNLKIAQETKNILKQRGVEVDILPATVPPKYWTDAFLAIHADGSLDKSKSGYKFAHPRRDFTGGADRLTEILYETYGKATGLAVDLNVTRNMRGYYAFAWWRYEHAVHPMTTAVIAETGFLTNPSDRRGLVDKTEAVAQGLASGIINFLTERNLLE